MCVRGCVISEWSICMCKVCVSLCKSVCMLVCVNFCVKNESELVNEWTRMCVRCALAWRSLSKLAGHMIVLYKSCWEQPGEQPSPVSWFHEWVTELSLEISSVRWCRGIVYSEHVFSHSSLNLQVSILKSVMKISWYCLIGKIDLFRISSEIGSLPFSPIASEVS